MSSVLEPILPSAMCYTRFLLFLVLLSAPAAGRRLPAEMRLPELGNKQASRPLVVHSPADYPAVAKVNYIQGRVRVEVVVSSESVVTDAHVLAGNPLLAAAALNAVGRWRYGPYATADGPTPFATKVEVKFALRSKATDLLPRHAESYFCRQVKPPIVLRGPSLKATAEPSVRLRLLVSEEGKVLDSEILKGIPSLLESTRNSLKGWSFRPAQWGTLSVPWYLDVDVPLEGAVALAWLDASR